MSTQKRIGRDDDTELPAGEPQEPAATTETENVAMRDLDDHYGWRQVYRLMGCDWRHNRGDSP